MDYNTFFSVLSYELKQSGTEDHDSGYEYVNFEQGMFILNESVKELVEMNGRPFETEEDFSFLEPTAKFRLPDMYNSASGYFFCDRWFVISGSSDLTARVRSINDRELIFTPPLRPNEVIKMRVVKYPADIINGTDTVDFPPQFMRFLRLHIMRKVMGRKGKEIAAVILAEYNTWYNKWINYYKTVKNSSFLQFEGYGFGRRSY